MRMARTPQDSNRPVKLPAHVSLLQDGWSWHENALDYKSLFNETPAALLSVRTDTSIQLANRHALRLLGYRSDELLGHSIFELYPEAPSGKNRARQVFLKFCEGAEIHEQSIEMQFAGGARVWVALTIRPVRDARGRIIASCSMVQPLDTQLRPVRLRPSTVELGNFAGGPVELAANGTRSAIPSDTVLIRLSGRSTLLRKSEIDWLQASGNYVRVHAKANSWLLRATMSQMEAKLDRRHFVRIHRSAIVNLNSVKELRPAQWGDWRLVLRDATQLTASRHYWKQFVDRLERLP